MGIDAIFDRHHWNAVPFHFWTLVFFVFGSIVGSFLNVCIHRMPLGLSIVSPPSHCPHCKYSIPWYLNLPLITWLVLGGRCRNCRESISPRYFIVELLTAIAFMSCWMAFGRQSVWLVLIHCLLISGLIVATFIDFEHFIIPDEITIGGMVVGFLCSLLLPVLHQRAFDDHPLTVLESMLRSLWGIGVGAGIVYAILRIGKMLFGRQRIVLSGETKVFFSETAVHWADKQVPYEEMLYRKTDSIVLRARTLELADRCYRDVDVRLRRDSLHIGEEKLNPEQVAFMEVITTEMHLPREAMGLGDVKFMGAIGAFLGWPAVVFSLMVSSIIGAVVGVVLIVLRRREWSSRLPYGPYIALAAVIWVFAGWRLTRWFLGMP